VGAEQRLHLQPQLRFALAGFLEELCALAWISLQRLREQLTDMFFPFQNEACLYPDKRCWLAVPFTES
jgi:hypothetical protein